MTDKEKLHLSKADCIKVLSELNCERAQAGHVLGGRRQECMGVAYRGWLPGSGGKEALLSHRRWERKKKVQRNKMRFESREEKTEFYLLQNIEVILFGIH